MFVGGDDQSLSSYAGSDVVGPDEDSTYHGADWIAPANLVHRVDASDIMYNTVHKPPKVLGEYVMGNRLGEGAFGRVKEGIHLRSLERVAIKIMKIMRLRKMSNGNGPANARKEILLLRQLRHRNVIHLHEVLYKPEKEKLYLVMEYCAGTLKEALDAQPDKKFPLSVAHDYFTQLLDGVEYMHSQGVIHRDIKPGNLLLTNAKVVKISDFGVADVLFRFDPSTTVTSGAGTRPFMSPELVGGSHTEPVCGIKVDIWACGVTLWNFTTGGYPFPFEHGSAMTLYSSISKGEYTIPEYLSEDLHSLLSAILTVNPAERISVAEIMTHPWFLTVIEPESVAGDELPAVLPPRDDDALSDQDRGTTLVPFLDGMHSLETLRSVHSIYGSPFSKSDPDSGVVVSPQTGFKRFISSLFSSTNA